MTEQRIDAIERRLADLERVDRETIRLLDRLTTAIELLTNSQVNQQRILNEHTGLLRDLVQLVGSVDDRLGRIEQILLERGHQNGASST
jgi:FMN phosphatase YigB (HAD superfamily)